jgi:ankyrin repeat-rich membrane spanning protein
MCSLNAIFRFLFEISPSILRISWLIFFFEMNEDSLDDGTPLRELYDKVRCVMPTQKELEPLLEMDRDEKKVATF